MEYAREIAGGILIVLLIIGFVAGAKVFETLRAMRARRGGLKLGRRVS